MSVMCGKGPEALPSVLPGTGQGDPRGGVRMPQPLRCPLPNRAPRAAGPRGPRAGVWEGASNPHPPPKANPRRDSEGASGCPWSTARATAPSPGRPTPGVVKQDKSSGGSVDTTKTRSGPQRVRMSSGERPPPKANDLMPRLCATPPPPREPKYQWNCRTLLHMHTRTCMCGALC